MNITYRKLLVATPVLQKILTDPSAKIGGRSGLTLVRLIEEINKNLENFNKTVNKLKETHEGETLESEVNDILEEEVTLESISGLDIDSFDGVSLAVVDWQAIEVFFNDS